MKMRSFFTLAVATLVAYALAPGCTQDFSAFETCAPGEKVCGSGCVAQDDPEYGCGVEGCAPCDLANAVAGCGVSGCTIVTCEGDFDDCDKQAANGCEVNLMTDPASCGACSDACITLNADPACVDGDCAIGFCGAGFEDCDGNVANGCEANVQASPLTCGDCDTACGPFDVCQNGQCVLVCEGGTADCDGNGANGCETQLGTVSSCGGCGDACDIAHATPACETGLCVVGSCDAGFEDCDGLDSDGCEADLLTSLTTCGTCSTVCPTAPNGTADCDGGQCTFTCDGGWADCDGDMGNGCETETDMNPAACGGCGQVCDPANATGVCTGGACQIVACLGTFDDCDGVAANGCEIDTATSVAHCGGCGRACSGAGVASRSCTAGLCDSTCDLGFANCTYPAAPAADNGCELSASSNDANCGGCGNSCGDQGGASNSFECDQGFAAQRFCGCSFANECNAGASGSCGGGLCTCGGTQCRPGEACVDVGGVSTCSCAGAAAGACGPGETCCDEPAGCFDLRNDPAHCGGCGRPCPDGFLCFDNGAFIPPECRCDEAADCDAGTGGAFTCNGLGRCVCNGNTCAVGERCQANGQCG